MKHLRKLLIIVFIGMSLILCSCKGENMSNGEIDWSKYIIPFDNSIDFVYDNCSRLTIKSFGGLTALAYLNGKYPVVSVHSNNGIYYTVVQIQQSKLGARLLYCLLGLGVVPQSASSEHNRLDHSY
jgi:hypothetical protein